MVAIVEKDQVDAFCKATSVAYEKATGLVPETYELDAVIDLQEGLLHFERAVVKTPQDQLDFSGNLALVAGLMLAMQLLDLYWLIGPDLLTQGHGHAPLVVHWMDFAGVLGLEQLNRRTIDPDYSRSGDSSLDHRRVGHQERLDSLGPPRVLRPDVGESFRPILLKDGGW